MVKRFTLENAARLGTMQGMFTSREPNMRARRDNPYCRFKSDNALLQALQSRDNRLVRIAICSAAHAFVAAVWAVLIRVL